MLCRNRNCDRKGLPTTQNEVFYKILKNLKFLGRNRNRIRRNSRKTATAGRGLFANVMSTRHLSNKWFSFSHVGGFNAVKVQLMRPPRTRGIRARDHLSNVFFQTTSERVLISFNKLQALRTVKRYPNHMAKI